VRQIDVELRRRDFKSAGIVCVGALHGQEWRPLGGGRAAPYQCTIGDRTLRIDAERTISSQYFNAQCFDAQCLDAQCFNAQRASAWASSAERRTICSLSGRRRS